jgi:hypothetical protein
MKSLNRSLNINYLQSQQKKSNRTKPICNIVFVVLAFIIISTFFNILIENVLKTFIFLFTVAVQIDSVGVNDGDFSTCMLKYICYVKIMFYYVEYV